MKKNSMSESIAKIEQDIIDAQGDKKRMDALKKVLRALKNKKLIEKKLISNHNASNVNRVKNN